MRAQPKRATNDPRFTQKGRASAWLIKARSDGSNAKWFQTMGRRFFILDFDKQIFYYTYTESRQAQASTPIPFVDILGAQLGHSYEPDADCGQHCHSRPRRCLPGSYPFTVRTKGKRLRLEAEEESEAFRWISMLNAAHRIGAEVDLLHCNAWLPPSTVPEQIKIKETVSEKTTADSEGCASMDSRHLSPPDSLAPSSEPPAPSEEVLGIVNKGNLCEPLQLEKTQQSVHCNPQTLDLRMMRLTSQMMPTPRCYPLTAAAVTWETGANQKKLQRRAAVKIYRLARRCRKWLSSRRAAMLRSPLPALLEQQLTCCC